LVPVNSDAASQKLLVTLNPRRQALVPMAMSVAAQDSKGIADVREFTPGHYLIHFRCATRSLIRVGNAYYPGWAAKLNGGNLPVFPVDHALIGLIVPAGEGDLVLDYHSTYFAAAAWVTLVILLGCFGALIFSVKMNRF
jgi:uncharacterized membrane protein YfhO